MHVYDFGSFHGFAARMSAKMLQKMEDLKDDFLYVEKNRRVSVHQTCFAEKTTLWVFHSTIPITYSLKGTGQNFRKVFTIGHRLSLYKWT